MSIPGGLDGAGAGCHKGGMDDFDLDARGLLCPLPVLRARKRLLAMAAGQVLVVRATDRASIIDMPHFCAETGHVYLGLDTEGDVLIHRLRRA